MIEGNGFTMNPGGPENNSGSDEGLSAQGLTVLGESSREGGADNEPQFPEEVRQIIERLYKKLGALERKIQRRVALDGDGADPRKIATETIKEDIFPIIDELQEAAVLLNEEQRAAIDRADETITARCQEIIQKFQARTSSGEATQAQPRPKDGGSDQQTPGSQAGSPDAQPPVEATPVRKVEVGNDSDKEFQDITKRSLESFMIQTGIPKREAKEEYKDIRVYLEAVHSALLDRASVAVLDGLLDPSSAPRTFNYNDNPMYGPGKEMDLITLQLIYAAADWQSVKTFESFLDEFPKYFSDSSEKSAVTEYKKRTREQLVEISVWHNRAFVRRKNQNPTGPDGAFSALQQIFENKSTHGLSPSVRPLFLSKRQHPELLESEERFGKAINLMMAFWALRTLSKQDRMRLWPKINIKLKIELFNSEGEIKQEFDVLPAYRSTKPNQIALVEKLVSICEKECNISHNQALLAYDIGEKFRIGAGLEAFMDVSYGKQKAGGDDEFRPENNVSVQAQEGEPKAANIGLYVDSAVKNTARPDFVQPFGEFMVHGYTPYSIAANYSYSGTDDIGEFGDHRATLAELMAVEGGTSRIDWSSGSTNPDKVVFQLANQTANFLWPSARLDKATKPEYGYFLDIRSIPLGKSLLLDREDEMVRIGTMLGYFNPKKRVPITRRVTDRLQGRLGVENMEQFGFIAKSEPYGMERVQRIKTMYKDNRDYWLNALIPDIQSRDGDHPYDTVRVIKYLFSRDDGPKGYVNSKIGNKIESLKGKSTTNGKWFMKDMYPWLQGYITYDLLLRSVYYLLQPDYRGVPALRGEPSDAEIAAIYEGISFSNFENFNVQTIAGTFPLNRAQFAFLINQSMLLLNIIPPNDDGKTETDKMIDAGYHLFNDTPKDIIFDQEDLLYLAQRYGIGEGYVMGLAEGPNNERFITPMRDGKGPTKQFIVDRLTLCNWLFSRKTIKK